MKYLFILLLLVSGCCQNYSCEIDSVFSDVTPMVEQANVSFQEAENKILNIKPDNKPDEILGPNPDVSKCICKGTGLIKHGDDHVTKCPYHGNSTTILKR